MHSSVRWTEVSDPVDGVRVPINSLCFSPSGDYVVASCGVRVLLFSASTGTLLHSLKGHRDTVYCVDYAPNEKRFASGGADHTVVVWSNKGEGIVKYQHKESIQALAHNPVTAQLASVSSVDWGLWAPEVTRVAKMRLPDKGLCAAWTLDGQTLAIGMMSGAVVLLDKGVTERVRVQRPGPVWTLAFSPVRENGVDVLAVGSWDQRLTFYNLAGEVIGKERELDFDPCSVAFLAGGEQMLVAGSDRKVSLYSKTGTKLITLVDAEDWVWCARPHPRQMSLVCGTNYGMLSCVDVDLTTVHSIYDDQYVYRSRVTNVVVQQLTLDRKMIIPCNEYVRKLATYRDRLAVLLPERIIIFELFHDDERNMRYQDIAQIRKRTDCTAMYVTTNMVVLCKERRMTLYDFQGHKRREWSMEAAVQFVKVVGGVDGREVLLVGLKNGQVLNVFVNNAFPTTLVKTDNPVRCLDMSSSRGKVAVVDEQNLLQVFDLTNEKRTVLFSETGVKSVAWNHDYDDMIAYSTENNVLHIRTAALPAYEQPMHGIIVGFKANRLFTLHYSGTLVIDVPHSHALYRYIELKDFDAAYRIACRGVTEGDWKMLGMHAMTHLQLDVARRAFTRIREVKFVELLNALELRQRQMGGGGGGDAKAAAAVDESGDKSKGNNSLLLGDILAFQGKFQDAARQFIKAGSENRAIEMLCDLKMWDEARKVCSDQNRLMDLIRQQARWAEDSQNYSEAASLYETCGDHAKAIGMMGRAGQTDKLMKLCRALPRSEVGLIADCATYFMRCNALPYAIEAYEKVGDHRALLRLYVEQGDWRHAFATLERCPEHARDVYIPWANWLADNDRFEEALEAFRVARWPKEAIRMMETLATNSVICRKFRDAAFYYVHLAEEYGQFEDEERPTEGQKAARIRLCNECVRRADVYYAYTIVYAHTTQPFPYSEIPLFRTTRYLLAMISDGALPMNVGRGEVLYTLARMASRLDMVRTARNVFEALQTVILPLSIMEQVDIETLLIRSRKFTDRDELLDVCFRCKQVVPQLTSPGDRCPNCFHRFVRSFVNFEALPLVEFTLSNELSDAEAERIIVTGIGRGLRAAQGTSGEADDSDVAADDGDGDGGLKPGTEWRATTGANVITFENDNIDYQIDQQLIAMGRAKAAANKGGDIFFTQLQYVTRPGRAKGVYQPFVVNADMLQELRREEVFIVKPRYGTLPVPNRYYRLVQPNVNITLCQGCQHFFLSEDYEMECMKGNGCPLCRHKPGPQVSRTMEEIMLANEVIHDASSPTA